MSLLQAESCFAMLILFVPVFSVPFYLFYLLGAITDMIDGTIARVLHQQSPFGAKLDTVADMIFVIVMLTKIGMIVSFPALLWIWITLIVLIKIINLIFSFVIYRSYVTVHSAMNKVTGCMLFILPLTIGSNLPWQVLAVECILTCLIATFAAVQEGHYIYTGRVTE